MRPTGTWSAQKNTHPCLGPAVRRTSISVSVSVYRVTGSDCCVNLLWTKHSRVVHSYGCRNWASPKSSFSRCTRIGNSAFEVDVFLEALAAGRIRRGSGWRAARVTVR